MVWKINKKKSDRGNAVKQKTVLEIQPNLKSCLKTTKDAFERESSNEFYNCKLHNNTNIHNNNIGKVREQIAKSGSRLRNTKPVAARSSGSNISIESKGSESSSSVQCKQHSVSSRSWDREMRKSETAQSTHSSEQSSIPRSISEVKKKNVRFNVIYIRDYERVVGTFLAY